MVSVEAIEVPFLPTKSRSTVTPARASRARPPASNVATAAASTQGCRIVIPLSQGCCHLTRGGSRESIRESLNEGRPFEGTCEERRPGTAKTSFRWLPRLIPHRHHPRGELHPAHEPQVDALRQPRKQCRPVAR